MLFPLLASITAVVSFGTKLCKLKFSRDTLIDIRLPKEKYTFTKKKSIVIHLSAKWINSFYSEDNFIELIKLIIKKEYVILLTTDNSTKSVFKKIFNKFPLIYQFDENDLTNIQSNVIIMDSIIYDPNNFAEAIHKEYAPWKSEYKKFTFDQKNLNLELIRDL